MLYIYCKKLYCRIIKSVNIVKQRIEKWYIDRVLPITDSKNVKYHIKIYGIDKMCPCGNV